MQFDPNAVLTRELLLSLPPLCLDGAWGTEMQKLGAEPGQMCDTWNLDHPDRVAQVAEAYVAAGAQVILTNTFNSNRIVLEKHGLANQVSAINEAGARISKTAAAGKAYVFGSIGPCGKMVMMGEIEPEEVSTAAGEQAKALAAGGADAIIIETQTDLVEAEALLKGCLDNCQLPVGVSFTFDSGQNNDRTMMGVSVAQAYQMAIENGASFVGANCGAGIETFSELVSQYRAAGDKLPVWVKGNAGKPHTGPDGCDIYSASPSVYAEAVPVLLKAGARFIGGCCGSGPEHIKAIAQALRQQG